LICASIANYKQFEESEDKKDIPRIASKSEIVTPTGTMENKLS
jgi:hypothetical protein